MDENKLAAFIKRYPKWTLEKSGIKRKHSYPNYRKSLEAVIAISELAEAANHHPDIRFGWGYLELVLLTHSESKVTEKDTELAKKIEETLGRLD
ncbi:UNVERIFIED_CONTAM: hypothetical protein GTU68_044174 [Idotea baltica]|nr:hypothetical protein [Idotea baltica]